MGFFEEIRSVAEWISSKNAGDQTTTGTASGSTRQLIARAVPARVPSSHTGIPRGRSTVPDFPRDPKDEPYINLALAANADYLVTRDNDLLDLMNDSDFRQQFPGLTILDPVAFLRVLSPPPVTDAPPGGTPAQEDGAAPA